MCTNIQGGHLLGAVDSDDLNLPDEILDGLNGFWIYEQRGWMNEWMIRKLTYTSLFSDISTFPSQSRKKRKN